MTEDNLCAERHKRVDETLDLHNTRLNNHSEALDKLSIANATNTTLITQLFKKLDYLTASIWGLVLVILGAVLTKVF